MTSLIDEAAADANLWIALGRELPRYPFECTIPGCQAFQPWDVFCPEHEHLLALGAHAETARWKPRWFLAHGSRLFMVAMFPLAARWDSPVPLFVLAIGVTVYVMWLITRNYLLTRDSLRYGFVAAVASWGLLRIGVQDRSSNESFDLVLSWLQFIVVFVAAVALWFPVRVFLRRRLQLNGATTLVAAGILGAATLITAAYTARGRIAAKWGLPHWTALWLVRLGVGVFVVCLIAAMMHTWWLSRQMFSVDVPPRQPRRNRSVRAVALQESDPTPVEVMRPPTSLAHRLRREVVRLTRGLRGLHRIVRTFLVKAALTIRYQILATRLLFRAARHLYAEAIGVGVVAAARCVGWLGLRVLVPILAAFVSTAASFNFSIQVTRYFQADFPGSLVVATKAAAYALLALVTVFLAWALVSGCDRHDVIASARGASRTVAPRLLLVFAVGAIVVEVLSMVWDISPIRFGPLTFVALALVGLSFLTDDSSSVEQPVDQ